MLRDQREELKGGAELLGGDQDALRTFLKPRGSPNSMLGSPRGSPWVRKEVTFPGLPDVNGNLSSWHL